MAKSKSTPKRAGRKPKAAAKAKEQVKAAKKSPYGY
jgi:hypothetical protein